MQQISYWYSFIHARLPYPVRVLLNILLLPMAIFGAMRAAVSSMAHESSINMLTDDELKSAFTFDVLDGDPDAQHVKSEHDHVMALIAERKWRDVGHLIESHDQARAPLPSGNRLNRMLLAHLQHTALADGPTQFNRTTDANPVTPFTEAALAYPDSYGLACLAASMHLSVGWRERGHNFADFTGSGPMDKFTTHLESARACVAHLDATALNAQLVAEIQYQTMIGGDADAQELIGAVDQWGALDPTDLARFSRLGIHLLPRWYGDYGFMRETAQLIYAQTHSRYGAAGYAAFFLQALDTDEETLAYVDMTLVREGVLDLIQMAPDPDVLCNLICKRLYSIGCKSHSITGAEETDAILSKREEVKKTFHSLVRQGLGVVFPDIWTTLCSATDLRYLLAETFEGEIMRGCHVHLGAKGAKITEPE
ncbi:hypothetical protein [uncultured Tateyamaria sp.]|uniref:hypothetical protein n=1 Tax=uncultured Tateyamaria sp. TaxID=455651 RepID=UPI00260FEB86|nr:hypothetical protein [uncultured Tateyamaria sp.]